MLERNVANNLGDSDLPRIERREAQAHDPAAIAKLLATRSLRNHDHAAPLHTRAAGRRKSRRAQHRHATRESARQPNGNRGASGHKKSPISRAKFGAGGGNRTRDSCLEGKGITIMQRPRPSRFTKRRRASLQERVPPTWWAGQDLNLRIAFASRVYSPVPLTTRPPTHGGTRSNTGRPGQAPTQRGTR